jgi:hypothetical protein
VQKLKSKRPKQAPRFVRSRYLPADRARLIAATIRDLQAKYVDHDEVAHVMFLVLHGSNEKAFCALEVAQPHFDADTVFTLMRDALSTHEEWHANTEELVGGTVVQLLLHAVTNAVMHVAQEDPLFRDTLLLAVHPSGAACFAHCSGGKSRAFLRDLAFSYFGLPLPSTPAPRAPLLKNA